MGPESLLNQYNVTVALNLPGVGNNLQDHPLVGTFYPCTFLPPSIDPRHCMLMIWVDNNASYPSPTELTTNATYNMEAEQEYDTAKTGEQISWLLNLDYGSYHRSLDGWIPKWFSVQSSAIDQQQFSQYSQQC